MTQLAFYGFSLLLIIAAVNVVLARNPVHSVLSLIFAFFNTAGLFLLLGAEFIAMILIIIYVGAVAVLFLFVVMMMNMSSNNSRPLFSKLYFKRALTTLFYALKYCAVFFSSWLILMMIPVAVDLYQQNIFATYPVYHWLSLAVQSPWIVSSTTINFQSGLIALVSLIVSWALTIKLIKKPYFNMSDSFLNSIVFLILMGIIFTTYFVMIGLKWQSISGAGEMINSPIPPLDLMTNTHAIGQVLYVDYSLAFQCGGIILLVAMIGAIVLTLRTTRHKTKRQDMRHQAQRRVEDTLELKQVPLGSGIS